MPRPPHSDGLPSPPRPCGPSPLSSFPLHDRLRSPPSMSEIFRVLVEEPILHPGNLWKWTPHMIDNGSLVWHKFIGIPLHAWSEEFFTQIGSFYGKSTAMVSNSDASKDNLHLDGFEKDDQGAVWGGRTPSFEYSNFLANGKRG
ncbi:hypothetical protein JHK82_055565 [Glycine max]|nr:hypothetical protein JHK82_055565 [Glycine max]